MRFQLTRSSNTPKSAAVRTIASEGSDNTRPASVWMFGVSENASASPGSDGEIVALAITVRLAMARIRAIWTGVGAGCVMGAKLGPRPQRGSGDGRTAQCADRNDAGPPADRACACLPEGRSIHAAAGPDVLIVPVAWRLLHFEVKAIAGIGICARDRVVQRDAEPRRGRCRHKPVFDPGPAGDQRLVKRGLDRLDHQDIGA